MYYLRMNRDLFQKFATIISGFLVYFALTVSATEPPTIEKPLRGDINLNGIAYDPADWQMFSRFLILGAGALKTTPEQREIQHLNADCNGDNIPWSVADFIYFERALLGDTVTQPAAGGPPEGHYRLLLPTITARPGKKIMIPDTLEISHRISGISVNLDFDTTLLQLDSVRLTDRISTFLRVFNTRHDSTGIGLVAAGHIGQTAGIREGKSEILRLYGRLSSNCKKGTIIPIKFTNRPEPTGLRSELADSLGTLIQPELINGAIIVQGKRR